MKTNRGVFWTFALTASLTTLTLVAGAQAPIFQVVPTPNQYYTNNVLYASSASSADDIWAVGNTAIHFNGRLWKLFSAPGAEDSDLQYLRGVLTFSPTLAWAGGGGDDQGQIIDVWNGQNWQRLQGVPFPPDYHAFVLTMSGTSPNDIWATGSINYEENFALFFEHWDGQSWGDISYLSGGVGYLYGASQDAPNDAYAVGVQIFDDIDIPLLAHYEGGNTWFNVSLPLPYGASGLYGILALAQNNVWAVGWQNPLGYGEDCSNQSLIYHFDGNSWTIVPSPKDPGLNLVGVVANSANDIYATGYRPDGNCYGFDTLLLHWDGNEWNIIPSPNPRNDPNFIANELLTGVAPSPGNVWIFGQQWFLPQGRYCEDCTLAIHEAP